MGDHSVYEPADVSWTRIVQQKRDDQNKKICKIEDSQALSEGDIDAMTNIDSVSGLASKIASGELKASAVVKAYIHR